MCRHTKAVSRIFSALQLLAGVVQNCWPQPGKHAAAHMHFDKCDATALYSKSTALHCII